MKRADLEAYIAEHGKAAEPPPSREVSDTDYDENAVRELLATCGQHLTGATNKSATKQR